MSLCRAINATYLSIARNNYVFQLAHIIPGLLIAAIPFLGDHPYACVACITVSFGFNGAASLTNYQNAQDLSPNYVGTVYALMNAAATSAGILSPLVVAHFTQNGVRRTLGHFYKAHT